MLDILRSSESLEENLSRSNFKEILLMQEMLL